MLLLASLCSISPCLSFPACKQPHLLGHKGSWVWSQKAALWSHRFIPNKTHVVGRRAGMALRGATSPSPMSERRSSIFFTPRPHCSLTANRCYCKHRNKGARTGEGDGTRKRERWKADKQPKPKQCWEKLNYFSTYSYVGRSWLPARSQGRQGSGGLGAG